VIDRLCRLLEDLLSRLVIYDVRLVDLDEQSTRLLESGVRVSEDVVLIAKAGVEERRHVVYWDYCSIRTRKCIEFALIMPSLGESSGADMDKVLSERAQEIFYIILRTVLDKIAVTMLEKLSK